ncbi:MAG TPA: GNAT family protein [Spirochaetia bacterium]|nr:GNAT family protein [Spirochaetia bacterium]
MRFTTRESRPRADELHPVLQGARVRLEPLQASHLEALCAVGLDPEVMRLMPHPVTTRDQMADYINAAISARAAGTAIPFVTVHQSADGGQPVVGSTRFMSIDAANRHLEIGSTWIGVPWQRTAVNTEAKYLMLRHAFETFGCLRVEFKTDSLNVRSRQALLRIGAREEGTFRSHVITSEGRIRHSVYFSITFEDWPDVRRRLEGYLSR